MSQLSKLFHQPCYLYKQEEQNITAPSNIKKGNQNHTVDYFLRRNKLLVIALNGAEDSCNSDQISADSSQSSGNHVKNIGEEMILEIKTPPLKQIQVVVDKKEVCRKL